MTTTSTRPASSRRRWTLGAVVAGVALAVGLGTPALAAPATPRATVPASVSGSVQTLIGHLTFSATNVSTSPGAATGSFTAQGDLVPTALPGPLSAANTIASFGFTGPVTCLDVAQHRAGLIYPINAATGPVGSKFQGQAIYITLQDNGPGQPQEVGFAGPAPVNSLMTCPALVPFLPVQSGHFTITPAH